MSRKYKHIVKAVDQVKEGPITLGVISSHIIGALIDRRKDKIGRIEYALKKLKERRTR